MVPLATWRVVAATGGKAWVPWHLDNREVGQPFSSVAFCLEAHNGCTSHHRSVLLCGVAQRTLGARFPRSAAPDQLAASHQLSYATLDCKGMFFGCFFWKSEFVGPLALHGTDQMISAIHRLTHNALPEDNPLSPRFHLWMLWQRVRRPKLPRRIPTVFLGGMGFGHR